MWLVRGWSCVSVDYAPQRYNVVFSITPMANSEIFKNTPEHKRSAESGGKTLKKLKFSPQMIRLELGWLMTDCVHHCSRCGIHIDFCKFLLRTGACVLDMGGWINPIGELLEKRLSSRSIRDRLESDNLKATRAFIEFMCWWAKFRL
jgi:hypothetical protein